MFDLMYVYSNLSAKGKKGYLRPTEKCGSFSANWVRMGGRTKNIGSL
jgi:hypothetical protein